MWRGAACPPACTPRAQGSDSRETPRGKPAVYSADLRTGGSVEARGEINNRKHHTKNVSHQRGESSLQSWQLRGSRNASAWENSGRGIPGSSRLSTVQSENCFLKYRCLNKKIKKTFKKMNQSVFITPTQCIFSPDAPVQWKLLCCDIIPIPRICYGLGELLPEKNWSPGMSRRIFEICYGITQDVLKSP